MTADRTIRFSPENSILKLRVGDEIRLTEPDFLHLFKAYFAELEARFV